MSKPAYRTEPNPAPEKPLRVFVLLAHGFGARRWKERWIRGELAGIHEKLPYGYFHCARDNCEVEYSEDATENRLTQFVRMCFRRLLGFDLIHAWRNRERIEGADVVWTHTELEHLAALLLFRLGVARKRRPRLIAQSVWLFDRWRHISPLRRWAYRRLLEQADVLTVLSPDNLRIARELFPGKRCEFIPFGIDSSRMRPAKRRELGSPLRVLSLGNDMHRDWDTLIKALGGWSECEVRIGGKRIGPRLKRRTGNFANLEIVAPTSTAEIDQLYEWADFVVIPLKDNFHASGITVIIEAVLAGVPVVCTDTGGLRAYFSGDEIRYIPQAEPERLRGEIEELSRDHDLRFAMARRAQARVAGSDLNSRAFAWRHFELSRTLLEQANAEPPTLAGGRPAANSVRVFVFLGHGFGASNWTQRWKSGRIGGINERLPYGYFHAAGYGWTIEYSEDKPEHRLMKYGRSALRLILGFDLIHAWRNRKAIRAADVIWTNTEFEHLAALLLLCRCPRGRRPRVIAESVWLFDRWPRMLAPWRWLYRRLLSDADSLTVLSPENLRVARALFPGKPAEFIPFGIDAEAIKPARPRPAHHPLRMLSLGNDIHRDWHTLIDAVKGLTDCEVRIGGKRIRWRTRGRTRGVRQIAMRRSSSAQEVADLYAWADLVVVPLKRNLHASGITVVAEAISCGVPVICTDTGGLRAYFSDDEVRYVAPCDPEALRGAILELARDSELAYRLVKRAQDRIVSGGMSSRSYAMRHRALSLALLTPANNHSQQSTAPNKLSTSHPAPRVFVFLGHGFGASWARGELPGINEAMPYGYYHAEEDGCVVTYSEDTPEGRLICLARMGLRRWLGFDLLHTWRNRRALREADVVWTHTELESLAALALLRVLPRASRPRVIAQSVWLFGRWAEFWALKRWLYQRLLRRADLLTVQCEANLAAARRLLPDARVRVVPYGIDLDKMVALRPRPVHTPIRILSLGRDMHRDWATLVAATAKQAEFEVRIGAKKITRSALAHGGNLTLMKPTSAQLPELYQWADLVVIPLKPNIHASGITVLAEAALFGVPVVCTGTGGLNEYFGDESVRYVPPGDSESMRRAINELAASDHLRFELARNAQARLIEKDLSTRARAKHLATLSRELLSQTTPAARGGSPLANSVRSEGAIGTEALVEARPD